MKTLILGGVRSGKSRLAERLARESEQTIIYIATAKADDQEMQERIAKHRVHRPSEWKLVEEPLALASVLQQHNAPDQCILIDCLTLWLTNLLMHDDTDCLQRECDALLASLPHLASDLVIVSNETNMGVIPMGTLSRRFCDEAGQLHQELAKICDRVILTVAGLPHALKGNTL